MESILSKYINIHSPGYVIEIYNNGKRESYVYGNKQVLPIPLKTSKDTLYDIASLTKVFVSTLIYIAYEEGKINIFDTIYNVNNKFINLKDVTVLELLSHSVELWTDGYLGDSNNKNDFLNKIYTSKVKSRLATYVDVHYMVLGLILEEIYNKDLDVLLQEKIFDKIGLKNTTFKPSGSIASSNFEHQKDKTIDNIEVGVVHDTKARVASSFGIHTGHAGIFTTAEDFMNFILTFIENDKKLLKDETIKFMLTHRDINQENYDALRRVCKTTSDDINDMYNESELNEYDVHISRPINNMGTRFRSTIIKKTDIPFNASENTMSFSGYSGPIFILDFENKIAIVMMCNVVHNSNLDRLSRKCLSDDIMNEIYDSIIKG